MVLQHFSAGILALLLSAGVVSLRAQTPPKDYDDVDPWAGVDMGRPGADSSSVAMFLNGLAGAHPTVCRLAVASIGNYWSQWDDGPRLGMLAGETQDEQRWKLSQPISDPGDLTVLGPKDPARSSRRLFLQLPNRGRKTIPSTLHRAGPSLAGTTSIAPMLTAWFHGVITPTTPFGR
jgi:hypothetical protein